jgi:hypothetical protein
VEPGSTTTPVRYPLAECPFAGAAAASSNIADTVDRLSIGRPVQARLSIATTARIDSRRTNEDMSIRSGPSHRDTPASGHPDGARRTARQPPRRPAGMCRNVRKAATPAITVAAVTASPAKTTRSVTISARSSGAERLGPPDLRRVAPHWAVWPLRSIWWNTRGTSDCAVGGYKVGAIDARGRVALPSESERRSCRSGVSQTVAAERCLGTVVQSRRSCSAHRSALVVRALHSEEGVDGGGANCPLSREPALHAPHVKDCTYTFVGMCVTWHL